MTGRVAYLLHFVDPATGEPARYKHAGHYLGDTDGGREADRLQEHRDGTGSVLTAAARRAGLDFIIARTWPGGALKARQLKSRSGASYCPECNEHPLPGARPRRPGAKYLTRRQREARAALAAAAVPERRRSLYELERDGTWLDGTPLPDTAPTGPLPAAHRKDSEMLGRERRADARDHAQHDARSQAEADALFAEADRLDDLAGQPRGYRQEITAERAARIRAQLGPDVALGDAGQLAALPDEEAPPGGACMSPGCDCAYGHPDRLTGKQQAAAEPGWVDAARWIPGRERDERGMAQELLREHAAGAGDAWRRERTATAGERLAELGHDEQALGRARQDARVGDAKRVRGRSGHAAVSARP
jgi:hypothetical protein